MPMDHWGGDGAEGDEAAFYCWRICLFPLEFYYQNLQENIYIFDTRYVEVKVVCD